MDEPRRRPSAVTASDALRSAWAVASRVAERALAPDGGFAAMGPEAVGLLHDEIRAAGCALLAALVADSEPYRCLRPRLDVGEPVEDSPWRDRFLDVEVTCRAAISIELERLLDPEPGLQALVELARSEGRAALADFLAEELAPPAPAGPALEP